MRDAVWSAQREWADDGYIVVDQDIRGKYGSEGDYVMTRPPIGPLNPTKTDDTTDAYDTIDWLVKNVPESNGRVGMIGSSYDGWTVTMALLGPHPALKVAAPESPMIDGWMGDDWFHYGAFRQVNLDYFTEQSTRRGEGSIVPRPGDDDYQDFLDAGTAGHWAEVERLQATALVEPLVGASRLRRLLASCRRWTNSWSRSRPAFPPSGCRACGTRKTCTAPSTRGKRSKPPGTRPTITW